MTHRYDSCIFCYYEVNSERIFNWLNLHISNTIIILLWCGRIRNSLWRSNRPLQSRWSRKFGPKSYLKGNDIHTLLKEDALIEYLLVLTQARVLRVLLPQLIPQPSQLLQGTLCFRLHHVVVTGTTIEIADELST